MDQEKPQQNSCLRRLTGAEACIYTFQRYNLLPSDSGTFASKPLKTVQTN